MNSNNENFEQEQDLTPDEEMNIAEQAYLEADFTHSAFHVARALSYDPANKTYLQFFNKLIEESNAPLELIEIPEEGEISFASGAARAYILLKLKEYKEAISLIFQVATVRPDIPYLFWVENELKNSELYTQISGDDLCNMVLRLLAYNLPERCDDPIAKDLWNRILRIVEHFRKIYPDHDLLMYANSVVARKGCEYNKALEVATTAFEKNPNYFHALAIAYVHKEKKEIDKALEYFEKCLNFQDKPSGSDIPVLLDMADMLCDNNQIEKGVKRYKEALKLDPNNSWALPSLYFYDYILTRDLTELEKLERFAIENPDNSRAIYLAEILTPFVGYLPEPKEATVNSAKTILAAFEEGSLEPKGQTIRMGLSSCEAPSSYLALELLLKIWGSEKPEIEVGDIPEPDPRKPRRNVSYLIWLLEDEKLIPALNPPSSDVASKIANLAVTSFHIYIWRELAKKLAKELGSENLTSLLGVMVHPPQVPPNTLPWNWIFQTQVASALTIAYLDDGWDNSIRKDALLSLLNGPIDWTVTAAIVALTELAIEHPELRTEIVDEFLKLSQARPNLGYWCVEEPLIWNILRVPNISNEIRRQFEGLRRRLFEKDKQ